MLYMNTVHYRSRLVYILEVPADGNKDTLFNSVTTGTKYSV